MGKLPLGNDNGQWVLGTGSGICMNRNTRNLGEA